VTFLIDENLGEPLARGMKAFGEDVVHLRDHFPKGTSDEVVLERLGKDGWFLITRDERIRRRPGELAALKEHSVGAFFLAGKGLGRCALIRQLVRNWHRIKEHAHKRRPPFALRVPPRGTKFTLLPLD
jgi:hypothetical protein